MTQHYDTYQAAVAAAGDSTSAKGNALEQLACDAFSQLNGVEVHSRKVNDDLGTQELDVVLWNDRLAGTTGLQFMEEILLVEAKNWKDPVGSMHVSWFKDKLAEAGRSQGILLAASGVTGENTDKHHATQTILNCRRDKIAIIVVRPTDLDVNAAGVRTLLKNRLLDLSGGKVSPLHGP